MNCECENRPHQTTGLLCKMDKWQHAFGLRWMSSLISSGVEGKLKVPSVVCKNHFSIGVLDVVDFELRVHSCLHGSVQ